MTPGDPVFGDWSGFQPYAMLLHIAARAGEKPFEQILLTGHGTQGG